MRSGKRKQKSAGTRIGYGNANDAVSSNRFFGKRRRSLPRNEKSVPGFGLQPTDIDYINVHGTATPTTTFRKDAPCCVFTEIPPYPFQFYKTLTGHTLAGCRGIEAVFSILAIQNGVVSQTWIQD